MISKMPTACRDRSIQAPLVSQLSFWSDHEAGGRGRHNVALIGLPLSQDPTCQVENTAALESSVGESLMTFPIPRRGLPRAPQLPTPRGSKVARGGEDLVPKLLLLVPKLAPNSFFGRKAAQGALIIFSSLIWHLLIFINMAS